MKWSYKFVISERLGGLWRAISDDDVPIDPQPMNEYLNRLGGSGWELVAVVPAGETDLLQERLLKHILKRPQGE